MKPMTKPRPWNSTKDSEELYSKFEVQLYQNNKFKIQLSVFCFLKPQLQLPNFQHMSRGE